MSVSKIRATLPKAGLSGLDDIADELALDPHRRHVVILLVDCGETRLSHAEDGRDEDGGEVPPGVTSTMRIRRAEVARDEDERLARRLLVRAWERRHGRVTLPLDTDLSMLGDGPETGEKRDGDR